MSGAHFRQTLAQYDAAQRKAEQLRQVLANRYGWDERRNMEAMRQVFNRSGITAIASRMPNVAGRRVPLGANGLPARRGGIF